MSIIETLPVVLATAGIALRFWQSRPAAPVMSAPAGRSAPTVAAKAAARPATLVTPQRGELISA
ncbi:MAG: hypothetical protein K2X55_17005 [Burkholderiaceae bacterium]|nr:hypothetical protein [Burkholderiaceae bacterium]